MLINVEHTGNTSAASIPVLLDESVRERSDPARAIRADCCVAFGAGPHLGAPRVWSGCLDRASRRWLQSRVGLIRAQPRRGSRRGIASARPSAASCRGRGASGGGRPCRARCRSRPVRALRRRRAPRARRARSRVRSDRARRAVRSASSHTSPHTRMAGGGHDVGRAAAPAPRRVRERDAVIREARAEGRSRSRAALGHLLGVEVRSEGEVDASDAGRACGALPGALQGPRCCARAEWGWRVDWAAIERELGEQLGDGAGAAAGARAPAQLRRRHPHRAASRARPTPSARSRVRPVPTRGRSPRSSRREQRRALEARGREAITRGPGRDRGAQRRHGDALRRRGEGHRPGGGTADLPRDQARAGCGLGPVPFLVMNSFATHARTLAFLRERGLADARRSPSCSTSRCASRPTGEPFREADGRLSPYAPGHGDLPGALRTSGLHRRRCARRGVRSRAALEHRQPRRGARAVARRLPPGPSAARSPPRSRAALPGDVGGAPAFVGRPPADRRGLPLPAGLRLRVGCRSWRPIRSSFRPRRAARTARALLVLRREAGRRATPRCRWSVWSTSSPRSFRPAYLATPRERTARPLLPDQDAARTSTPCAADPALVARFSRCTRARCR